MIVVARVTHRQPLGQLQNSRSRCNDEEALLLIGGTNKSVGGVILRITTAGPAVRGVHDVIPEGISEECHHGGFRGRGSGKGGMGMIGLLGGVGSG